MYKRQVELHATGEALAILRSVEGDLATLLIVSQAKLVEGLAGGVEATGREDLKVTVQAAEGEKCERCWIYSDTVGKDAEHPTVCARCAAAVSYTHLDVYKRQELPLPVSMLWKTAECVRRCMMLYWPCWNAVRN